MAYLYQTPELTTPGSAVAEQLQNILTNRRAMAQQKFMNELQQQNMRSEMAYRQQQARSLETEREARAQEYKDFGAFRQAEAARAQNQAGADQRMMDRVDDMINNNGQNGNPALSPDVIKQLWMARLGGPQAIRQVLGNIGKQDLATQKVGHIYEVSPTGKVTDTGIENPNGNIMHQLPQPYPTPATEMLWMTDHKGHNIPYNVDKRGLKVGAIDVPPEYAAQGYTWSGMGNNPTPGPRTPVKGLFDQKAYTAYLGALKAPNASPQARASAMNDFVSSITDPDVQSDVTTILKNPKLRGMSYDDLTNNGILTGDENHMNNVATILGIVRGSQ